MCKIIGLILTHKYIMAYYIIAQTNFLNTDGKFVLNLQYATTRLIPLHHFSTTCMHVGGVSIASVYMSVCMYVCVCVVRVYCVCL